MSTTPSNTPIAWPDAAREHAFHAWLNAAAGTQDLVPGSLRSASSDASFRRYFRVDGRSGGSFIVMDAPPPQEDVTPFVKVTAMLLGTGLNAPRVLAQDAAQGFLLLTDLGTELYLNTLQDAQARGDAAINAAEHRPARQALVEPQGHRQEEQHQQPRQVTQRRRVE